MDINKTLLSRVKYLIQNRFILFILLMIVFVLSSFFFSGTWLPSTETKDLWFYSGLFMVLFSILFIEPYYTSPKNVIANVVPLLLVFLSIKSSFINGVHWWIMVLAFLALLVFSIVAMCLNDKQLSEDHLKNRVSAFLKKVVVTFGTGKLLYSIVFVYFLLTYYSIQDFYTVFLFLFWLIILAIDPKKIHNNFLPMVLKESRNQIGEIFSVQSKKMFLAKLFEDRKSIKRFDIVKFHYSMQDNDDLFIIGIVFDTYLLNQEKWAKVLQLMRPRRGEESLEKNVVYKITEEREVEEVGKEIRIDEFVGVVVDGSTIGKIKFEYSKKKDDLQEGDLLELNIGTRRLFYQVITGVTEKERLEARNETGFIESEAIQLGEWDVDQLSFQKFGWVPSINTPIFIANTFDIEVPDINYPLFTVGIIPGTSLPSVLNLDDAISHHLALLGVTGAGKSFIAREIIDDLVTDTKVICVDFNKEFVTSLTPPPPNIIDDSTADEISTRIDWINKEMGEFLNNRKVDEIKRKQNEIEIRVRNEIEAFLDDKTNNISVFELPDVSNTLGIFDYTKYFFRGLFEIAKERQLTGQTAKICVVLEEAHTIIPEWNFSGSGDKVSQGLVNSIGQITLQGRKYGIGFLVIAQRTANVSKTVLTQCNTVICFQAFDQTSFNFLSNYIGGDMVRTLPDLKQFHAVVAGKAISSNTPMIVDLTRD